MLWRFFVGLIVVVAAVVAMAMMIGTGDISSFFASLNIAAFIFPLIAILAIIGMLMWYRWHRASFTRFALAVGLVALAWLIINWWLACTVPGFYAYVAACLTLFMFLTGLWIVSRLLTRRSVGSPQNLLMVRRAADVCLALAFAWLLVKIGQYVADHREANNKATPCCSFTKSDPTNATTAPAVVAAPTQTNSVAPATTSGGRIVVDSTVRDMKPGEQSIWVKIDQVHCTYGYKIYSDPTDTVTINLGNRSVKTVGDTFVATGPADSISFTNSLGGRAVVKQTCRR